MRADVYLSVFGHTESRKKAQDLIDAGAVSIDGAVVKKSSALINEAVPHEVAIEQIFKYVSRGGIGSFVPMNANFGIVPRLEEKVRGGKKARYEAYSRRALEVCDGMAENIRALRDATES